MNMEIQNATRATLPEFVRCLTEAFNDKFPHFFENIPAEKYRQVMVDVIWDTTPKKNPLPNSYLAFSQKPNKEIVAAFRLIPPWTEKESRRAGWRALRKHLSLLKSAQSGYWLQELGQRDLHDTELYIDFIGVEEAYRGKGVGTQILDYIERLGKEKGMTELTLLCSANNPRAKKLYEREGFYVKRKEKFWFSKWRLGIAYFDYMVKPI